MDVEIVENICQTSMIVVVLIGGFTTIIDPPKSDNVCLAVVAGFVVSVVVAVFTAFYLIWI